MVDNAPGPLTAAKNGGDPSRSIREPLQWAVIAPQLEALGKQLLLPEEVPAWLRRWSDVQKVVREAYLRLHWERIRNLADDQIGPAFQDFVERVMVPYNVANQALTAKVLAVDGWEPADGEAEFVRQWRSTAAVANAANVAIEAEITALVAEYEQLTETFPIIMDGREISVPDWAVLLDNPDRAVREAAWRARRAPWLQARERLDRLFMDLLAR